MSDWHIFWLVLVRDPYLFLGFLLVGASNVAWWYIYRKLREVGFKYKSSFILPAFWLGAYVWEYARTRAKFGWPAWPLHVTWLSLVLGIALLVIGVSNL